MWASSPASACWDHPRGCGEKIPPLAPYFKALGSSPRVRGKVLAHDFIPFCGGIIPAGAGKRTLVSRGLVGSWDHPRGCGEKTSDSALADLAAGSSPRVRGKGAQVLNFSLMSGIIPAGAGKRRYNSRTFRGGWDHPRGCGEKWKMLPWIVLWPGSSPRVRGKAPTHHRRHLPLCIIPAGAGKSRRRARVRRARRDHPRGCGEKPERAWRRNCSEGSSPRVRGKVLSRFVISWSWGIIPAGAGKRPR